MDIRTNCKTGLSGANLKMCRGPFSAQNSKTKPYGFRALGLTVEALALRFSGSQGLGAEDQGFALDPTPKNVHIHNSLD